MKIRKKLTKEPSQDHQITLLITIKLSGMSTQLGRGRLKLLSHLDVRFVRVPFGQ